MNVRFACPMCDLPIKLTLPAGQASCPHCDHLVALQAAPADDSLARCLVCENAELYRKKDFPHWLGMLLLVAACVAFLVTNSLRQQWLAWGILLGSALIDGVLYLVVGDVIVCYRCEAHHRGFAPNPLPGPYELTIGERYRQERLRREQVQAERKTRA